MADIITQLLTHALAAWRRRAIAIAVAWIVALFGWTIVSLMPDKFQSSAVVHVSTAGILQPLLRGLTIALDYQSEIDLMQKTLLNRPNIERVMRETDLDLTAKSAAESEKLIKELSTQIKVTPRGVDIFAIQYQNNNPQLAHDVVQSLLNIFVESNLGQSRGVLDTARRFIDDQIEVYEQRLQGSEQRLAEFAQKNLGLVRGQSFQQTAYESSKQRLETLESELRDAELRRSTLIREIKTIPQFFPTKSAFGAGPPTDLAIRILQAQQTLDGLLTRYTEKHPDAVVARRQLESLYEQQSMEIEAVAANAAALQSGAGQQDQDIANAETGIPNPIYAQIKIQLVDQEATVATLRDRVEKASAAIDEAKSQAGLSLEIEVELARLNRDHSILMNSYNQLLASRETEQLSRARDDQGEAVRFRVMEPPTVPTIPVGPNRVLFLVLVLIVSIGSGVGLAVLLALSSETFSNLAELRSTIGVPILGSVSSVVRAGKGVFAYGRSAAFWAVTASLFATFAGLSIIEVRLGLNEIVTAEVLTRLPASLLQRLPIS